MNKIIEKEFFSPQVARIVVEAPEISKTRKAGHFVIVRLDEKGERIPLTISSSAPDRGTITLVVQQVGVTSAKLIALEPGDEISDVVGPLGKPHILKKWVLFYAPAEVWGVLLSCPSWRL